MKVSEEFCLTLNAPLRKLPMNLSSFGVGGFTANSAFPFGFSSVLAAGGPLALVSFLHNHPDTFVNKLQYAHITWHKVVFF